MKKITPPKILWRSFLKMELPLGDVWLGLYKISKKHIQIKRGNLEILYNPNQTSPRGSSIFKNDLHKILEGVIFFIFNVSEGRDPMDPYCHLK